MNNKIKSWIMIIWVLIILTGCKSLNASKKTLSPEETTLPTVTASVQTDSESIPEITSSETITDNTEPYTYPQENELPSPAKQDSSTNSSSNNSNNPSNASIPTNPLPTAPTTTQIIPTEGISDSNQVDDNSWNGGEDGSDDEAPDENPWSGGEV